MLSDETINNLKVGDFLFDSVVDPFRVLKIYSDKVTLQRVFIKYRPKVVHNKISKDFLKKDLQTLFFPTADAALKQGLAPITKAKISLLMPKGQTHA